MSAPKCRLCEVMLYSMSIAHPTLVELQAYWYLLFFDFLRVNDHRAEIAAYILEFLVILNLRPLFSGFKLIVEF